LWTLWTNGFYIVHIVHNSKHFGKVLGTLWQSVDNVDTLDSHFKSLAYNIALMEIYKYVVFIE
jgi:hypothetical protein